MSAMTALSMGIAKALALQFPGANKGFVDVGGAQGCDRAGSFTSRRQQTSTCPSLGRPLSNMSVR